MLGLTLDMWTSTVGLTRRAFLIIRRLLPLMWRPDKPLQPVVTISIRCCALSIRIFTASTTVSSSSINDNRIHQTHPGFPLSPFRLLQLTAVWCTWWPYCCITVVQNAGARLISGPRQCDHIMLVLHQLHWLPVQRRLEFKVAWLLRQSLSGLMTSTLSPMHSGRRLLRSVTGLRWIATRPTASGLVLSNSWSRLNASPSVWMQFAFLFQQKSHVDMTCHKFL